MSFFYSLLIFFWKFFTFDVKKSTYIQKGINTYYWSHEYLMKKKVKIRSKKNKHTHCSG